MYPDTLLRLGEAVRRKGPETWKSNIWFLLHDNTPSHPLVFVKDFLAKNNVITLDNPTTLLTWLQLIFTSFLHGKNGALLCY